MAKVKIRIIGERAVQVNLSRVMRGIRGNLRLGLKAAGDFVKERSEDLTSIDTGKLIGSTFNTSGGTRDRPFQVVGYKEDYAAAVHEMPDSTNWQRAGAENQFLEKAVTRYIPTIFNLIARGAGKRPR